MPLVFIHGVNVRSDEKGEYDRAERSRNAKFRRFALSDILKQTAGVKIFSPYWGKHAAKFYWNQASLPRGKVESFGLDQDELAADLLSEHAVVLPEEDDKAVLTVARANLHDAIDLIWAMAPVGEEDSEEGEDKVLLALGEKALRYAEADVDLDWLNEVEDDEAFLTRLQIELESWTPPDGDADSPKAAEPESFGGLTLWNRLGEGLSRLTTAGNKAGTGLVLAAARKPLHNLISRFLGDVFVYLNDRGTPDTPGPIVKTVVADLEKAVAAKNSSADPYVIVVAHSMGGNILYDVLTHFRPDIQIDVLVTVGSQVAVLEELKLYGQRDLMIPADPSVDRLPRPTNVKHWLNVYDPNDVLSFMASGVFSGVKDYQYSAGKGLLSAHTTYFERPSFHDRLGAHLKETLG